MCGIAGILDLDRQFSKADLQAMCDVIRHRGPDGDGYYIDGPIGLGHRRLRIIDLEGGKQPMTNEDSSVWITFNGEIYNFQDLQKDLTARGHNFHTHSDTEAIIHAYEEYGESCVEHLKGMFSFAIWDSKEQKLFLARDRVGKKPLYYYLSDKKLIFASEIKAIIQNKTVLRDIDLTALRDYLIYLYIPPPKTIFKNIFKLPPGHCMVVDNKLNTTVRRYWNLEFKPDYSIKESEWIEGLREKLLNAVKIRLISDVPLGAFLSGGIDSSAVVAMMSQVMDQPVKTFSIGFEEEEFSELKYARMVAEKFNTNHHEMIVRPDAIELLPKLAWEFDEPFADSSAIPTYYVSKMAREHVTVVLSGDGGDETFAGYSRYASACYYHSRHDKIPGFLRRMIFGGASSLMPRGMRGKGLLRHLSETPFKRYRGMITQDEPGYIGEILSKDVLRDIGRYSEDDYFLEYYNKYPDLDYLTKIQYLDTMTYLPEDILVKVDRASMLNSLETRAPLLDHEILEYLARVPSSYKLRNGEKKYLLKKALEGVLPTDILYRKKMGFGVPLVHWFKRDISDYTSDILLSKRSTERNLLNRKYIESLLKNHQHRGRDLSVKIWNLLFFENWCREWLD